MTDANWLRLSKRSEIAPGKCQVLRVGSRTVAIFNVNERFFAIEDLCPHRGGPLSEGTVEDEQITCPWHRARFDLKTGARLAGPPTRDALTFETRVVGEWIEILSR